MENCKCNKEEKRSLTCDQVCWIYDAIDRYRKVIKTQKPGIAEWEEKAAQFALLLEIMELLGLKFADDSAKKNAVHKFIQLFD